MGAPKKVHNYRGINIYPHSGGKGWEFMYVESKESPQLDLFIVPNPIREVKIMRAFNLNAALNMINSLTSLTETNTSSFVWI
jgi:hypothetical protein